MTSRSPRCSRVYFCWQKVYALYIVGGKGAVGVVPVSCCAVNCTNRFKRDSGIGFYTIPAKQVRREAWLRAISRAGWEAKSSDRICGKHFVSGSPSRDPKNVDYVPTLFKDGKRRANCSVPDRERKERSAKRAKVLENEEDVLTAAEGLLNMSAMASSCEDALRDASTQTNHAFLMLDPKYLVPANQELSVEVAALQEELESLKHSLPKSPLQLMANSNQKTKFYTGLPTYEVFTALFHYLEPQALSFRQKDVESETVCGDFEVPSTSWLDSAVRRRCTRSEHSTAYSSL